MRQKHLIYLIVVMLALGCGRAGIERASVSGMVYVDGQPLESGVLNFIPEGGRGPTAGAVIEHGEYAIDRSTGVMVGPNRVEIRANGKSGRRVPHPMFREQLIDEIVELIPAEYNTQSRLLRQIESGHNSCDFEIRSLAAPRGATTGQPVSVAR